MQLPVKDGRAHSEEGFTYWKLEDVPHEKAEDDHGAYPVDRAEPRGPRQRRARPRGLGAPSNDAEQSVACVVGDREEDADGKRDAGDRALVQGLNDAIESGPSSQRRGAEQQVDHDVDAQNDTAEPTQTLRERGARGVAAPPQASGAKLGGFAFDLAHRLRCIPSATLPPNSSRGYHERRVRPLYFVGLGIAALAAQGVGCARSSKQDRPVAALSRTSAAAAAFEDLRLRWEERRLTRAALDDFLKRFPDDAAAPHVKVYLAFQLIDTGQLLRADGLLSSLSDLRPGTTRDLATVARARSLRLHGAPQSAIELLRPLVGKVIDNADREVFLEELALSAIGAHDDYEALAYLDAWLRGVGEDDRERVRAKVAQMLETLPRPVLEQTYRTMRARGSSSGYGTDTQSLVAARLARVAVETNDATLARWLLDVSGVSAAQTGGDAGVELGELAASRRGLSVVSGRTVGLLLPTRDRELRDEAADVVRGVSWALDLPRSAAADGGVRLVTREDGGDVAGTKAAMEELAGEGATLILAGFDRRGADRASAWSEANGVPVLLLAAPSADRMPRSVAFVLGERVDRELMLLADALARHGVGTAAFVADSEEEEASGRIVEGRGGLTLLPPVRCDVPLAEAGKPRFPIDSWLASGAQGWLVSGPTSCSRDVVRDLQRVVVGRRSAKKPPAIALTLEAGMPIADLPKGVVVLAVAAGTTPVLAAQAADVTDPDIRAFMEHFGSRPSYWTALGRDAGILARAAMAPLPGDTTSETRAIAQRRAIVQAGLLSARSRLWTSDEKGFSPDRVLARSLHMLTWSADK